MKKLIALFVLILVLFSAWGQQVADSPVTVTWDELPDTPLATYTYEVWTDDGTTQRLYAEVAAPPIVINVDAVVKIGVRTKRNVAGTIDYSPMNWSDVNGAYTPDPFFVAPALDAPIGLKVVAE